MKPCDCKSKDDENKLSEQGFAINGESIGVDRGRVIIEACYGNYGMSLTRQFFRRAAEWYLAEQEES